MFGLITPTTKKRAAIKGCFFREWEVLQPRVKTIRGFLRYESLVSMLSAIIKKKAGCGESNHILTFII